MADIYIIYACEDSAIAKNLHELLEERWDTWWDEDIVREWHKEIEAEILKAKCIVPLFSKNSREKATIIDELNLAKSHNKKVIPLKLDDSKAPYSFGTYSRIDMRDWNGEADHPGFKQLKRKLAKIVLPKKKPKRPPFITSTGIPLPALFLSVSSYNTQLAGPFDAVRALRLLEVPAILVSAYDLIPRRDPQTSSKDLERLRKELERLRKELEKYRNKGGFVLLDSGNYEASRLDDKSWCAEDLKEALAHTPHDWAFCFDNMNPSMGHKLCVKGVVEAVERDQSFTSAPVLPIIHAPKLKEGGYKLKHIPQIVREVSEKLEPPLIAIPERELGAGLIARSKMVRAIREELNKLPNYQPLHLLGTGNPWAIAVLAAAGADTFDGLEWCRYTMYDTDNFEGGINHFHLFDLFGKVDNPKIGFAASVAFHNLNYFKSFGNIMHGMFTQDKIESFVQEVISKKAFSILKEKLPELFE